MNSESTTSATVNKIGRPRPLSPHLQVYSWLITSTLSILHRLTGIALSVGLLYLSAWLITAAYYPDNYNKFMVFAASPIGIFILAAWSLALAYHFCNGIRHLFWDLGKGFEVLNMTRSGIAVLIMTVVLTATGWALGLGYIKL